jgi:hypothetical protein
MLTRRHALKLAAALSAAVPAVPAEASTAIVPVPAPLPAE